ncbi:MAG: hypothetical protein K2P00_01495 [Alistipes sp.]|nr:hypothetical protein [Alistipes sp.]
MKIYKVQNPYLVFSVKSGKERKEYMLKQGDTVELPEDDIAVRAMLARGQIKEVSAAPTSKAANGHQ